MRTLILLLCTIMMGCATPEQIAARRYQEAQAQEQRNEAYTATLAAQCDTIGYQRGTDAWRNCLLQLHTQAQAEQAQMRGIAAQEALRRQYQQMPLCSTLPAFQAGYQRAQGTCR